MIAGCNTLFQHYPGISLSSVPALFAPGLFFYGLTFQLEQCDPADWPQLIPLLPAELITAVKKRQVEYLLGRYCAQQVLLAAGAEQVLVGRGSDRAPQWPSGYIGSISHTDGQVIACASRTQCYHAVGIDMEKTVSGSALKALYSRVITPAEQPLLCQQGGEYTEAERATLIFSAKESLFKALYPAVRRYFDFHAAEVIAIERQQITLCLREALSDTWQPGRLVQATYRYHQGIVITLVALSPLHYQTLD